MTFRVIVCFIVLVPSANLDADDFASVQTVLESAVEDGAFPGCSAAVGWGQDRLWIGTVGFLDNTMSQKVTPETIYDLASLTKVVGTTTVAMRLFDRGAYSLDDPVVKWIPEFAGEGSDDVRRTVTVRHLLLHTSGLPSWRAYYKEVTTYPQMIALAAKTPLVRKPGEKYEYSDLGMILMGELLSRVGKKPLHELEQELVFGPLKMASTLRTPPESLFPRIAPTEEVADLGLIRGVVHDENARSAEGLTGHAGLFSTAGDLALLAREMLRAGRGESEWLSAETVKQFTTTHELPGNSRRGLGWQGFTSGYSGGTMLSPTAYGHTGFTGTSIWIDPEKNLFVILLTNRVHPTRKNQKIAGVRREFADAAVKVISTAASP